MDSPAEMFRRQRLADAAATSPEQFGRLLRPSLGRARQRLGDLAVQNSFLAARLQEERHGGEQQMDVLRSRARTWRARAAELESELRWRWVRPEAEVSALRAELSRCRALVCAVETAGTVTSPSNVVDETPRILGFVDVLEPEPNATAATDDHIAASLAVAAAEEREHELREEVARTKSRGVVEARTVECERAIDLMQSEVSHLQYRRKMLREETRAKSLGAKEAYQYMVQCAVGVLEVQQRMHQMEDCTRSCELASSELQLEYQTETSSAEYIETHRGQAENAERVVSAERQELLLAVANAHAQNQILAEEANSVVDEQRFEENASMQEALLLRESLVRVEASTPCRQELRAQLNVLDEELRGLRADLDDRSARARRAVEECRVCVDEKSAEASETKGLALALRKSREDGRDLEASVAEEELECQRQEEALEEARWIPSADRLRDQLRCEQRARAQAASSYETLEASLAERDAEPLRSSVSSSCASVSFAAGSVGSPGDDSPDSRRFRGQRAQLDRSVAVRLKRFEQRLEAQRAPEARRLQGEQQRLKDALAEAQKRRTQKASSTESVEAAAGPPRSAARSDEDAMLGTASFQACQSSPTGSARSAPRYADDLDPGSSGEKLPDVATVISCQGRWAAAATMAARERLAARVADRHASTSEADGRPREDRSSPGRPARYA